MFDKRQAREVQYSAMKPKLAFAEGKTALNSFTQTMKALFRVPKSDVQEQTPKESRPKTRNKRRA
jgi:hypothetical protein